MSDIDRKIEEVKKSGLYRVLSIIESRPVCMLILLGFLIGIVNLFFKSYLIAGICLGIFGIWYLSDIILKEIFVNKLK
ncbi:hypothetical protein [Butyricicoccus pullicaecorum]|uniref:hypothetical protein n=1 Tax=Butyricicoccus pullicaecorum TaxID=501571 RepID=UPI003990A5FB